MKIRIENESKAELGQVFVSKEEYTSSLQGFPSNGVSVVPPKIKISLKPRSAAPGCRSWAVDEQSRHSTRPSVCCRRRQPRKYSKLCLLLERRKYQNELKYFNLVTKKSLYHRFHRNTKEFEISENFEVKFREITKKVYPDRREKGRL